MDTARAAQTELSCHAVPDSCTCKLFKFHVLSASFKESGLF